MAVGVLFTVLTKFVQVRRIKDMFVLMFKGNKSEKGISSFQALSIALSGRVGTGNIAGTATAIGMGGPGAVFWMWLIADTFNGLMAVPNLIALLLLSGIIAKESKDFIARRKSGELY